MLFLTRKLGESVVINDDVIITVSEIRQNSVKITFDYPSGTRVLRQEVYNRIQEENKRAASQADQIRSLLERKTQSKQNFVESQLPILLFDTDDHK